MKQLNVSWNKPDNGTLELDQNWKGEMRSNSNYCVQKVELMEHLWAGPRMMQHLVKKGRRDLENQNNRSREFVLCFGDAV